MLEAALGYFMAPLGTMLLGVVVLHERASRLQRLAIGLAALAVVVLTISYGRPPVVALVIAASWSFYGLLKRQVPLSADREPGRRDVPAVRARRSSSWR